MDFNKVSSRLERLRILLFNSLSNENIKSAVDRFGYNEPKLQQGIALYNETVTLFSIRENSMDDQVNTMLSVNAELKQAKELFKDIVTITRRVFKPITEGNALLPDTIYITDFDLWKAMVFKMYYGILELPQLLSKLGKYGYTEEVFRREIEIIKSLEKTIEIQKVKNIELQNKTALRNQKLKELQEFCTAYQEIAVTALAEQPMLLEIIGLKVLKKYLTALEPPKPIKIKKPKK
jgi:hypothetical protein